MAGYRPHLSDRGHRSTGFDTVLSLGENGKKLPLCPRRRRRCARALEKTGARLDLHSWSPFGVELDGTSRRAVSGRAAITCRGRCLKMKSPTGEEIRRAFKPDRQLGGGVLSTQSKGAGRRSAPFRLLIFS